MKPVLVLDNSILSHLARADACSQLGMLCEGRRVFVADEVSLELRAGLARFPGLQDAIDYALLRTLTKDDADEDWYTCFAECQTELGTKRNLGDAATLAWASVLEGTAIIDDAFARNLGIEFGISVEPTFGLLWTCHTEGRIDKPDMEDLVNLLRSTGMKLPRDPVAVWAAQHM